MKKLILVKYFLILSYLGYAQPPDFGFGKQILIDASQVSGPAPLTNFPILISITDLDLRSIPNGGQLENTNGFDIIFTLADCITTLSHDLEYYNPVTGELVIWVQIPLLDNAVDTPIFMYYGNSSISSNLSTTNIWTDAGYDGVWHLHNDFLDASGSGNNGENNGSINVSPAHNSADGQNFVDPNHWIELPSHPNRSGSFSYSGWVRTTNSAIAGQRIICDDQSNGPGCHALSIGDPGAGRIRFYIRNMGPVSLDSPGGTIINNTWHYIAATFNSTSNLKSLYVDGVLVNSATVGGTLGPAAGPASIGGEVPSGEAGNRFNGDIDEVRATNNVLSSDWITTEYNNQNSPSTFYTISPQIDASSLCALLPIELLDFNVAVISNNEVSLTWVTGSEINNNFFTIERSRDGLDWEFVLNVNGAGTSSEVMEYQSIDKNPYYGDSYYRLKQTDFDGEFEYSMIRHISINRNKDSKVEIYPNPTKDQITIEGDSYELKRISITNLEGQDVQNSIKINKLNNSKAIIDLSQLPKGVYIIETRTSLNKVYKQ